MTNTILPANLPAQHFSTDGQIDLINDSPNPVRMEKGKSDRKRALLAVSLFLTVAVGFIALIIGTSAAEAANVPAFSAAKALAAKQDASIAGVATASIAFIAFGAIALFSTKRK